MDIESTSNETESSQSLAAEATQEIEEQETDGQESDSEHDSEESETEDSEASNDDESEEEGEEKNKKSGKFKRRVDKLKAKIAKQAQEAEYWKELALKNQQKDLPEKPAVQAESSVKPDPNDFENHEEYFEALADYKVEQRLEAIKQKEKQEQASKAQQEKASTWQKRIQEFSEKTPDFEEVMENADEIELSPAIQEAILESDLGAHVIYELAKNPEEAIRIGQLSASAAFREIGKLEGKILSNQAQRKLQTVSKAPRPLSVTKGSAKVIKDPSNMSFAEYEAWRKKQQN